MKEIAFVGESEFPALLAANELLVAQFTALWCGPCKAISPIVDKWYAENTNVEIVRVDLDQSQTLAAQYSVSAVPTFIFFENGKEVNRVQGAQASITTDLANFSKPKVDLTEFKLFVPKGYGVLNSVVHLGETVTLNTVPLDKDHDAKTVFRLDGGGVVTDADSQGLFFVPLNNVCKLYSVLIQWEEHEDSQPPLLIKIWQNKPGIMSFEDAVSDSAPPHKEVLELKDGWFEAKVKYVRFQKVQNLNIFVDGDDEDTHTYIKRIVLVGLSGESTEVKLITHDDSE